MAERPLKDSPVMGCNSGSTKYKVPQDNLTREQRRALKQLRELKDEVILPADKGMPLW